MPTITSIGTGSGIDLEGLVGRILEAERAPTQQRLDLRVAETEASISAYGSLKSTLSTFQATVDELSNADKIATRSATTSNEKIFTASAKNGALATSNSIQVLNLASAHKLASPNFTGPSEQLGGGKLTLALGSASISLDVKAGVNDSLSAIRDAINADPGNPGIAASLITVDNGLNDGGTVTKLVLSTAATGSDKQIRVTVDETPLTSGDEADAVNKDATGLSRLFFAANDPGNQATELSAAQDARITVDGLVARSSTNSFTDVIEGVTITAVGKSEDPKNKPPETLTVSANPADLQAKIDAFVVGYNELMITINTLTNYDPETKTAGLLNGDSGIRSIETQLRRALGRQVSGSDPSSSYTSLASIGLTTNRDGTITLDSKKFGTAIKGDIDQIGALFAGDNGLAKQVSTVADRLLASDGLIKARSDGFDKQMRDLQGQRVALDQRLTAIEERTRAQFAGLDTLISRMQSTSTFLTQQLANISAQTTKK